MFELIVVVIFVVAVGAYFKAQKCIEKENAELERSRRERDDLQTKMDRLKTDWPAASRFMTLRRPAQPEA